MTHEVPTAHDGRVAPVRGASPAPDRATAAHASTEQVWAEVAKASFAIVSYVTPAGEPRSSGIVYATEGRHLYLAVAPDGWKARQISGRPAGGGDRTGPAGRLAVAAYAHPTGDHQLPRASDRAPGGFARCRFVPKKLQSLLPTDRRAATVLELVPEGTFLTYGIGVSLMAMRDPVAALTHVPMA